MNSILVRGSQHSWLRVVVSWMWQDHGLAIETGHGDFRTCYISQKKVFWLKSQENWLQLTSPWFLLLKSPWLCLKLPCPHLLFCPRQWLLPELLVNKAWAFKVLVGWAWMPSWDKTCCNACNWSEEGTDSDVWFLACSGGSSGCLNCSDFLFWGKYSYHIIVICKMAMELRESSGNLSSKNGIFETIILVLKVIDNKHD